MKRLLLLAVLALVPLAACDSGTPATPTPGATATPLPAPPPSDTPTPTAAPPAAIPTALPTIVLPPAPTTPPTPSGMDEAQTVEIYNLVVRDLIKPTTPPYLALAPTASLGEHLDTPARDRPIPPALLDKLQDLHVPIEFVPFIEAIGALETGGRVRNNGLYLTFGVIESDPAASDSALLYASFYRASDDATGFRYTLTRANGQWAIKDRTQIWNE